MVHKCVWVGVLLVAVLLSTVPALSVAAPRLLPPAQAAPNLQNPGFEGISCRAGSVSPQCLDNWTRDTLDGSQPSNVFTPQGWVAWWRTGSGYGGPSVEVIPKEPPFTGERLRIHGGYYATRLFISWNIMDAGLLQTVSGLTPGATVQLSAYGHTWACTSLSGDSGAASSCGGDNMSMQVGIDPNGARDFNSPSIVWSPENPARDSFVVIGPATAQVGTGGSVTVFLRGKSKWGFQYQEAYWDDVSLVYTSQPSAPAATTVPGVPAGQPTAIAGSDGLNVRSGPGTNFAILAHVNPGTQLKITGKYADWWQVSYNNAAGWVYSGVVTAQNTAGVQQVAPPASPIPPPPTSVPPTPMPTLTSVLPTSAAVPTATAAVAATGASICVLVYHDRNGDTFRNDAATEELLPNAEIALADTSGVLNRYTTNGIAEPYCFTVAPGTYRVIQTPPMGYVASGGAEQTAAVADGSSVSLQFGDVRGQGPAATGTAVATPAGEEAGGTSGSSAIRIFSIVAKVSGVLVLIVAAGLAVLFVFSRRRR